MSEAFSATVGWSAGADPARTGREAAEKALEQLSVPPTLALMFGSSWFNQGTLLQGVRAVLGDVPLAGESTAGEIVPEGPLSHSCVVMLIASPLMACSVGVADTVDRMPRDAGHRAAQMALQGFRGNTRTGFLLFGDGLVTSYADVVRGIQEVLGTGSLIVGGMAGDDLRFAKTYQYANDRVLSRSVVGVLLGGPIKIGVGIEHGFVPISKPRRITRARANILYELDQQPAASVYEEYFGAELLQRMREESFARQRIAYPLGIQREQADQWLLRNVVAFGEDGSLACSGEMLQDAWLQLMIGSRELALDASRRAAQQAASAMNRVGFALVFDAVARRQLLGSQQAAREIASIRETLGFSVPLAGCYTYGEQAPSGSSYERTALQTGSVLVIAVGT